MVHSQLPTQKYKISFLNLPSSWCFVAAALGSERKYLGSRVEVGEREEEREGGSPAQPPRVSQVLGVRQTLRESPVLEETHQKVPHQPLPSLLQHTQMLRSCICAGSPSFCTVGASIVPRPGAMSPSSRSRLNLNAAVHLSCPSCLLD